MTDCLLRSRRWKSATNGRQSVRLSVRLILRPGFSPSCQVQLPEAVLVPVLERVLARSFAVVLEVLLVQVLALAATWVQALGPVVLVSRKLFELVLVQVLALTATLMLALGPNILPLRTPALAVILRLGTPTLVKDQLVLVNVLH